jgi:hypothetical protein
MAFVVMASKEYGEGRKVDYPNLAGKAKLTKTAQFGAKGRIDLVLVTRP